MKKIIVLLLMILLQSCNSNDGIDNSELIKKIDAVKEIKSVYEIQTDSLGSVIDTISALRFKNNKKGDRIFEERKILNGKNFLRIVRYYSDSGNLLYSKSESSESGILSIYQSQEINEKVQKAISYNYEDNKVKDTSFMGYDYVYKGNKILDKLVVSINNDTAYGFKNVIAYNENEKPYLDVTLSKDDTISKVAYHYKEEQVIEKTIKNYKDDSLVEISYNNNGHILSEDFFIKKEDTFEKVESIKYETNDNGDVLKKTIISYPSMAKKNIIYKYVSN